MFESANDRRRGTAERAFAVSVLCALIGTSAFLLLVDAERETLERRFVERFAREVAALQPQLSGTLRVEVSFVDNAAPSQLARWRVRDHATHTFNLWMYRPDSSLVVGDTEIRGFLDGEMQSPFNQGTAYHMRIGRRYDVYRVAR